MHFCILHSYCVEYIFLILYDLQKDYKYCHLREKLLEIVNTLHLMVKITPV